VAPAAVTSTGISDHQRISTVAEEMNARDRSVFIEHAVSWGGRFRDRPHGYLIRGTVNQHRRLRRYPFEQQWLYRFEPAIRMETLSHDAGVDHVIYSHQR